MRIVIIFFALLAACVLPAGNAGAERPRMPADHSPKICLGSRMEKGARVWYFDELEPAVCAAQEAMYGASKPSTERRAPAENINFVPVCCPLPASDILLEEQVTAPASCPPGFVATASPAVGYCRNCPSPLRCTKINTERYQLSEPLPGRYWGTGFRFWHEDNRLMRLNVPAAIRYALGRTNLYSWSFQGCVGYPYGSLLVGKESKSCRGLMFRQLQFKGGPGDPPAGTPVAMFPECDEISDRLDPNAYCVKSSAARSER